MAIQNALACSIQNIVNGVQDPLQMVSIAFVALVHYPRSLQFSNSRSYVSTEEEGARLFWCSCQALSSCQLIYTLQSFTLWATRLLEAEKSSHISVRLRDLESKVSVCLSPVSFVFSNDRSLHQYTMTTIVLVIMHSSLHGLSFCCSQQQYTSYLCPFPTMIVTHHLIPCKSSGRHQTWCFRVPLM